MSSKYVSMMKAQHPELMSAFVGKIVSREYDSSGDDGEGYKRQNSRTDVDEDTENGAITDEENGGDMFISRTTKMGNKITLVPTESVKQETLTEDEMGSPDGIPYVVGRPTIHIENSMSSESEGENKRYMELIREITKQRPGVVINRPDKKKKRVDDDVVDTVTEEEEPSKKKKKKRDLSSVWSECGVFDECEQKVIRRWRERVSPEIFIVSLNEGEGDDVINAAKNISDFISRLQNYPRSFAVHYANENGEYVAMDGAKKRRKLKSRIDILVASGANEDLTFVQLQRTLEYMKREGFRTFVYTSRTDVPNHVERGLR